MRKWMLSLAATLMLLVLPSTAHAAGGRDDNGKAGNAVRGNQVVNQINDMTRPDGAVIRHMNNGDWGINGRRDNWDNNMATRSVNNRTYRTNATDNDTDWGWLGLLGLIGLAGMMGRGRDRGDAR
ncbi:hypothetical protein PRECH8_02480 [Insulibacter thermoxylanivorax]|uniref:MYXO-CTERM domain-containing protein n=1 Tax=Insulibacter thermoxylanivorax TaxID=2749268 RepID=A0A916VE80_9BACL|nr:WGxxGxxG family protein [Insulibacter thermoxylanivorax]GFR36952.1 hypothetical protein PRECH8_02480 [Insulibacter thermoxylanivorax]